MKFGTQSRSSSLMINMIFEILDLDPRFKILADCLKMVKMSDGLKIVMCPIFMKFSTQHKLSMLIMNIVFGINDLDPKL